MSITSRINEMSSHIEQAYDELQGLGADLTNVNKNIENISMVLDDIYDSMPQVSGEGTNLTLDDTRVGKIKSTLKGNTSQTTYSGKNLLPNNGTTLTRNGMTFTVNDDGSYTLNGTTTSATDYNICQAGELQLEAGTYTLSSTTNIPSGMWLSVYEGTSDRWAMTGTNTKTMTVSTATTNARGHFYINNGVTLNNLRIYPMIVSGTTVGDYEPYTGKTPSPNPSYPQPINVVSGDNEINVVGKNILENTFQSQTANGITFTRNDDGSLSFSGTATQAHSITGRFTNDLVLRAGTSYIFSLGDKQAGYGVYLQQTGNVNVYYLGVSATNSSLTITPTEDTTITQLAIRFPNGNSVNGTIYPMLEVGSSATSYEPYQGNTYNIDLPEGMELCKIGNYQDYFYKGTGKNLLPNNATTQTINGVTFKVNDNKSVTLNGTASAIADFYMFGSSTDTGEYLYIPKGTYSISAPSTGWFYIGREKTLGAVVGNSALLNALSSQDCYFYGFIIRATNGSSFSNLTLFPMINEGSTALPYEPYGSKGKWLLRKEIGKIDISNYNNTEPAGAWSGFEPNGNICMVYNNTGVKNTPIRNDVLSNKFTSQAESMWNGMRTGIQSYANDSKIVIGTTIAEVEEYAGTTLNVNNYIGYFKTYIISLKPDIYIILATPTTTEITYQPLIDQLNLLEKAMSKDGQTNISQVNNDLPFIISASALKEWSV